MTALARSLCEATLAVELFAEDDDATDGLPCGCSATTDCEECAPLVWCDGVRTGSEDDDG